MSASQQARNKELHQQLAARAAERDRLRGVAEAWKRRSMAQAELLRLHNEAGNPLLADYADEFDDAIEAAEAALRELGEMP